MTGRNSFSEAVPWHQAGHFDFGSSNQFHGHSFVGEHIKHRSGYTGICHHAGPHYGHLGYIFIGGNLPLIRPVKVMNYLQSSVQVAALDREGKRCGRFAAAGLGRSYPH